MSLVTINGHTCSGARVQCADWGCWWFDATLTEPVALSGAASISFAGESLQGTIIAGGAVDGRAAYRVVGGRGGWGKEIGPKSYLDDGGVKASTAIGDAARESGETVDGAPDTRVGPVFTRATGTASQALNELAPRAWRVDFDGATRFGKRATTSYTGSAVLTGRDLSRGIYTFVAEDVAGFLPGVTIEGSAPSTDVEYELVGDKPLIVRVWAGGLASRALNAIERIVLGLFPDLRYRGAFEYRVVTQSGERLNLQPVRSATGMPDLQGVAVRPGMAGLKCQALLGSLVVVQFLDADPSRPVVTGFDAPDAPGWMPLMLELGGPGALGVARIGDSVVAGPYAGVITSGSARVKAAL